MPVFALLLIAVVAEFAVIIAVGEAVGALWTILLLIAVSMAGVALLRRQGTRTLTSFTEALRARRDPSPEMADGMLIGVAAALVLFPGFLTDVAALLLLFPPTRAVVRKRLLTRAAARRGVVRHDVVDGEVVEDDPIIIDAPTIEPRRPADN
ncbi:FxsA family protein [Actinophytocola sp. NPDC049390]|uniref:FxsA family protein n=1 Tax=Actinophytocola sp. NPDC049390 TaxID=3363894 RepID=UPI003787EE2F